MGAVPNLVTGGDAARGTLASAGLEGRLGDIAVMGAVPQTS